MFCNSPCTAHYHVPMVFFQDLTGTDGIQKAIVIKAQDRTYITGVMDESGKRKLIVEISERMSSDHRGLIAKIAAEIARRPMSKAGALALRAELLGKCK